MIERQNRMTKVPLPIVLESYQRLKSVWKVGEELGISAQTAHNMLTAELGPLRNPEFTDGQKAIIIEYYKNCPENSFDLHYLCDIIGKNRKHIGRFASTQGLTKKGRPHNDTNRKTLKAISADRWKSRPHPRGMLGKKHTPENIEIISQKSRKSWATMKLTNTGSMAPEALEANAARLRLARSRVNPVNMHCRSNCGKRPDLGDIHFRSSWEANYARYLNLLMKMKIVEYWEFEPETFWFEEIRRGVRSYLPDFRVKYKHDPKLEYVEIKGWITAKDRTKWKRMKKYYPHIKLVIVAKKEYYSIRNKWRSSIPTWEEPQSLSKVRAA